MLLGWVLLAIRGVEKMVQKRVGKTAQKPVEKVTQQVVEILWA